MDTTFDKVSDTTVAAIIAFYKPAMEQKMNEVIGKSAYELRNSRPESLLSNFTADALLNYAKSFSKGKGKPKGKKAADDTAPPPQ